MTVGFGKSEVTWWPWEERPWESGQAGKMHGEQRVGKESWRRSAVKWSRECDGDEKGMWHQQGLFFKKINKSMFECWWKRCCKKKEIIEEKGGQRKKEWGPRTQVERANFSRKGQRSLWKEERPICGVGVWVQVQSPSWVLRSSLALLCLLLGKLLQENSANLEPVT